MVAGEPGIGKTALVERLASYVSASGGQVLVGHCVDEAALSLPYLPFVEALGPLVRNTSEGELKALLDADLPELAKVLPEIGTDVQLVIQVP